MGGYGAAGKDAVLKKNVSGLGSHYKIRVTATVIFGDSWNNEYLLVKVDDIE